MRLIRFVSAMVVIPVLAAAASATVMYTVTNVGTLGGWMSEAYDVNNVRQVVGRTLDSSGQRHAFLWESGVMTDLTTLGSGSSARASVPRRTSVFIVSY